MPAAASTAAAVAAFPRGDLFRKRLEVAIGTASDWKIIIIIIIIIIVVVVMVIIVITKVVVVVVVLRLLKVLSAREHHAKLPFAEFGGLHDG